MRHVDGNVMRIGGSYGSVPAVTVERPINPQSPAGRAVVDREIVHLEDAELVIASEYPEVVEANRRVGARTVLAVPLLREGIVLGITNFAG